MALALIACLMLTAALGWWIFTADGADLAEPDREIRLQALRERKRAVYDNLKDLHFERLAGKLSEADFAQTRRMLESEAGEINAALERVS